MRVEDALGTPTHSHISRSVQVYEDENISRATPTVDWPGKVFGTRTMYHPGWVSTGELLSHKVLESHFATVNSHKNSSTYSLY
jgi:hypothetical protein